MLDNLLTNKYMCLALILALLVVLYMYSQKGSCTTEGMDNVDLTPLAQELSQPPWTDRAGADDHRRVDGRFSRYSDKYVAEKLAKNGNYAGFMKRSDQNLRDYMENYDNLEDENEVERPYHDQYAGVMEDFIVPRPLDDRPDLSQCQPCRCEDGLKPRPRRKTRYDEDSDYELLSDTPKPKRKGKKQMKKKN